MKAVKANKVYTVDEISKAAYLAQGYDITDDDGKVIERAPSSTVSRAEYDKVLAELNKLKAEAEDKTESEDKAAKSETKNAKKGEA